jgi:peroxiredoxin
MKKALFYLITFCPLLAAAQTDTFTINGKIGTITAPAKVYLAYQLGANKVLDSAFVTNGMFSLTGNILFPVAAKLLLDHTGAGPSSANGNYDMLTVYLDKGTITVTGTDSMANAKISGSAINDDYARLNGQLSFVNARAKKLIAHANSAPADQQKTAEFQNNIQAKLKVLQTEQEGILKTFIKANPNSYLSLMALSSLGGPAADPKELEPLFAGLSPDLKVTEAGRSLGIAIDELKSTAIGALAPDFTQNDANGTPIKLSSFRGKYVLIDFWASWCGPCRLENPNVVRVYNKYKTKKFTIMGVSLDRPDGKADWLAAVQKDELTWTQVSDLKYWNNEAAALYFVRSIPQNYLIGPDGKIIAKDLRGEDLENKLAEIFGKI